MIIAIFDKDSGEVKRWVSCPAAEILYNIGPGEDYVSADAPAPGRHHVVDGMLVAIPDTPPALTYDQQRALAYPPIGDQLDAIWRALAANPNLLPPDAQAMLTTIQDIKARFPAA